MLAEKMLVVLLNNVPCLLGLGSEDRSEVTRVVFRLLVIFCLIVTFSSSVVSDPESSESMSEDENISQPLPRSVLSCELLDLL